jgi:NAD-dependent SIR2 family protein deacetylase
MPDVVFFGGTVPGERVGACSEAIADADGLLVVGSSLQVFSGFRFCRLARALGKPLAIINPGTTRGDPLATLKLATDCEPLLAALAADPSGTPAAHPSAAGSPS